MPWPTGPGYAKAHNKKLKGKAASTAAKMATGMVNKGMDEGKAIRIANAKGNQLMRKKSWLG